MNVSMTRALIERHEGRRALAYDDADGSPLQRGRTLRGAPTVGIGHNLLVPLSDDAIDYLFSDDLAAHLADCESFPWFAALTDARQAAVLDAHFNLGAGGFRTFRKFLAAMARGAYDEAATELLDSDAARQLTTRYAELAEMIRLGTCYPED